MKMNVWGSDMDETRGSFRTEFSYDDYCRTDLGFIPICYFIEALGQAAEYFYIQLDGACKRYLAKIEDFNLNIDIYKNLDKVFSLDVEIIEKFGKFSRSRVVLTSSGTSFCEGVFLHCNE